VSVKSAPNFVGVAYRLPISVFKQISYRQKLFKQMLTLSTAHVVLYDAPKTALQPKNKTQKLKNKTGCDLATTARFAANLNKIFLRVNRYMSELTKSWADAAEDDGQTGFCDARLRRHALVFVCGE
jgi:hypothetical protein